MPPSGEAYFSEACRASKNEPGGGSPCRKFKMPEVTHDQT